MEIIKTYLGDVELTKINRNYTAKFEGLECKAVDARTAVEAVLKAYARCAVKYSMGMTNWKVIEERM